MLFRSGQLNVGLVVTATGPATAQLNADGTITGWQAVGAAVYLRHP